jgi:membrane protein DedA with SNARE-associated domain
VSTVEWMSWEHILKFATAYGYGFLFVTSVLENTFLLGLVVPGDVVVVLGGGFAAQGRLDATLVTAVVILGVLLGSIFSFWIGRRGGIPLIDRWGSRFNLEPSKIERVHAFFRRHGAKTVFAAAFVSGLKNLVPAVAGASEMGFGRFVAYNAAGSAVRTVALVAIGYACGANLSRALEVTQQANGWAVAATLALLTGLLALRFVRKKRRAGQTGAKTQDRVDRGAP